MLTSLSKFKDPQLCRTLLERIQAEITGELRFMEVCGTHTVAIFQSGLHSLLPAELVHLSGPGCPVCVTHESEVNAYLELAGKPGVVIATFGDLMKVPGSKSRTLKDAQAEGARVEVVYSAFDALAVARKYPNDTVVFLGVGFETTAPTIAATIKLARTEGLSNFKVLSFHKLVPPALDALLGDLTTRIDAFILPGHVSAIIGMEPYALIADKYHKPAVVTGFEPLDILQALLLIIEMQKEGRPRVVNQYRRVVNDAGNPKALAIMHEVFAVADGRWRGIGTIPGSGLVLSGDYQAFDAQAAFGLELKDTPPLPGCKCGNVLKGQIRPDQCPLFKKACTPATPVGPCMVSAEGSCAAYFKYKLD